MRAVLLFTITVALAFWAADKFCFDGQYTNEVWQKGNHYGEIWQREAKQWVRHAY